jgi:hypothetical protein
VLASHRAHLPDPVAGDGSDALSEVFNSCDSVERKAVVVPYLRRAAQEPRSRSRPGVDDRSSRTRL